MTCIYEIKRETSVMFINYQYVLRFASVQYADAFQNLKKHIQTYRYNIKHYTLRHVFSYILYIKEIKHIQYNKTFGTNVQQTYQV